MTLKVVNLQFLQLYSRRAVCKIGHRINFPHRYDHTQVSSGQRIKFQTSVRENEIKR